MIDATTYHYSAANGLEFNMMKTMIEYYKPSFHGIVECLNFQEEFYQNKLNAIPIEHCH